MIKTTTSFNAKKIKKSENLARQTFECTPEPSKKNIDKILNYSRSIFIKKSIHIGIVENLLN